MVQIKLSVAFVLAAAAIAPIVAVPVKQQTTVSSEVKSQAKPAAVKADPKAEAVIPLSHAKSRTTVLDSTKPESGSDAVAHGSKQRNVQHTHKLEHTNVEGEHRHEGNHKLKVKGEHRHEGNHKLKVKGEQRHTGKGNHKLNVKGKHTRKDNLNVKGKHTHKVNVKSGHSKRKNGERHSERELRNLIHKAEREERHIERKGERQGHHEVHNLSVKGSQQSGRKAQKHLEKAEVTPTPGNGDYATPLSARDSDDLVEEFARNLHGGGYHHHHTGRQHRGHGGMHHRHAQADLAVPAASEGGDSATPLSARDDLAEEFERSFDDIDLESEFAARDDFDEMFDLE